MTTVIEPPEETTGPLDGITGLLDEPAEPAVKKRRSRSFKVVFLGFILLAIAAIVAAFIVLPQDKATAPIKSTTKGAWNLVTTPEGFPQVATRCAPFIQHTRLWISESGTVSQTADHNCS